MTDMFKAVQEWEDKTPLPRYAKGVGTVLTREEEEAFLGCAYWAINDELEKAGWKYTPYDLTIDKILTKLKNCEEYSQYQNNLDKVIDYINELEKTIYGYTE